MNTHEFSFLNARLEARPSGVLFWRDQRVLVVSDLHLCKASRLARRGGTMLPPYETADTLARLEDEIGALSPETVICLGDSFDDLAAAEELSEVDARVLASLQAGREWIWIEGNHDPGPVDLGGSHRSAITIGALTFRHIAAEEARGEVSGHYHPKATLAGKTAAAFLYDARRVILPAFGTYTGGLRATAEPFGKLFPHGATAVLTGRRAIAFPLRMGTAA